MDIVSLVLRAEYINIFCYFYFYFSKLFLLIRGEEVKFQSTCNYFIYQCPNTCIGLQFYALDRMSMIFFSPIEKYWL